MNLDQLPLSRKQFMSIGLADYRVNLWEGSVRSGKTISSIIRWLMFLADPPAGGQLLMVGRTRDSLYRNVIQPMTNPDIFGEFTKSVRYTPGAPTAYIMGRVVHVMGASDVSAEKTLRGLTLSGAYMDEATIIAESFFNQLLARMSVPRAQLFCTTNPDSQHHWLKTNYLDRIDALNKVARKDGLTGNWARFHFTLDDNPALSDDYKASIKSEYTGLWYKRFIEGQWVSADGAVYDMWDPETHIVKWEDTPPIVDWLSVGIDYGTTNATSAILAAVCNDGNLYLVDEWRFTPRSDRQRMTDGQLTAAILTWLNTEQHHPDPTTPPPICPVIVDPAAASFRVQMKQDGCMTYAANNDVLYGIRTVSSLLAAGQLKVTDRCTGFISEVTGYVWDKKATEKGEDAVIKTADHSLDAARYGITTTEKRWRGYLPTALPTST